MRINCDWCGGVIHRAPNKIRMQEKHFCNSGCYGKWRDGKPLCGVCRKYVPKGTRKRVGILMVCEKCRGV